MTGLHIRLIPFLRKNFNQCVKKNSVLQNRNQNVCTTFSNLKTSSGNTCLRKCMDKKVKELLNQSNQFHSLASRAKKCQNFTFDFNNFNVKAGGLITCSVLRHMCSNNAIVDFSRSYYSDTSLYKRLRTRVKKGQSLQALADYSSGCGKKKKSKKKDSDESDSGGEEKSKKEPPPAPCGPKPPVPCVKQKKPGFVDPCTAPPKCASKKKDKKDKNKNGKDKKKSKCDKKDKKKDKCGSKKPKAAKCDKKPGGGDKGGGKGGDKGGDKGGGKGGDKKKSCGGGGGDKKKPACDDKKKKSCDPSGVKPKMVC